MSTIVPEPTPTQDGGRGAGCVDPHVDGCPGCVTNVEPPTALVRYADRCDGSYRCSDCGHTWETSWGFC